MKKNRLFPLFAALLSLSALSLSFSSPVQNLRGTVRFFGSSPFTFPGFEAEDGSQYTLEALSGSEFTIDDISSHAGELIEISGKKKKKKVGPSSLPGGHIIVESYEIVSPLEEDTVNNN